MRRKACMTKCLCRLRRPILCALCAQCAAFILSGCSRIDNSGYYNSAEIAGSSISVSEAASVNGSSDSLDPYRYIYSQLTPKEKENYEILKNAVCSFESTAVFPEPLSPDELKKLFLAVYYQEEEIFWLTSMFFRPQEDSDTLNLTYRFPKADIASMQQEIDAAAEKILSSLDSEATDYEKLRTFHDYLVLNCSFSEDSKYANTIYGGLVDGYAQCEGYAFSFDYLCHKAGIPCLTSAGTNTDGLSHAWNMVMLDGMWYNVDCTWDDPILDPVDTGFIRHYYFLVSDSDISGVTHIPDNTFFSLPICASPDNYYLREGLYSDSGKDAANDLKDAALKALSIGRKDAAIRFSDRSAYNDAVKRLFDDKEIKQVLAYASSISDNKILKNKYIRYCNDDELIIHISMQYE